MKSDTTVSVVIPTYRRTAELLRCLRGLEQQGVRPDEVVIGVRDDDDVTRVLLATPALTDLVMIAVDVGRSNASAARNRCLERATGVIIAMIDDDTVPRPGWLMAIRDRFVADASLGGIGGPDWPHGKDLPPDQRPDTTGRVQWWGRRVGNHHLGATAPVDVEWLKGANMSFRRDALRDGVFRDDLRGDGAQFAEDVALSLRVRRSGWRLVYDPAVAVDHYPGELMAGADHRGLADRASLADAAHNETIAMLDYLPPLRRTVFLVWAALVGTRLLPGAVVAALLALRGPRSALDRWLTVQQGRLSGWRTWHRSRLPITSRPGVANVLPITGAPVADRVPRGVARVCIVTHVVVRGDGQGRVNYELARYLALRGHQVTLVATEVDPDLLELAGIAWIRVPVPAHLPALLHWGLFALLVRWKLRGGAVRAFDIMHLNGAIAPLFAHVNTSHFVHAGWQRAAMRVTRKDRLGALYQRVVTGISSYSERRAYHAATQVVAVSDVVRTSLADDVGLPAARVAVIHTGVDTHEFRPHALGELRPLRETLELDDDAFLLLFVGDAKSPRKNLDLPLRALKELGPNFHLVVVGGSDGGPYAAMAAQLGVADRSHFLGARLDVARCYRDADAVICAAHYEPASLVLLEAMASALPVIATPEVGNATFLVDGENGFLLPSAADVEGTVRILNTLANDPARRRAVGECARATAVALSWERMGRQYEELYFELRSAA